MGRALLGLNRTRRRDRREPAGWRNLHKVAGGHSDYEIGNAKISKRLQDTDGLNQVSSQRSRDERTGAKAADGDSCNQAPSIWKPLNQHRNRDDVTKPESDASDEAVTQIEPP